jgi:hypothetical protein
MPTFRKVCSDLVNSLNSRNLDNRLSYRFLSDAITDAANTVLNQDADYRRLFQISNLWTKIDCIPMKEISFVECNFDISGCEMIQKSELELPDYYTCKYGDIIKINNINYSKEYRIIKPEEYRAYKDRKFQPKNFGYCWIINKHIYIPDTRVETVTVRGMFKRDIEVRRLNCDPNAQCLSLLDSNFNFPDYIITLAKDKLLQAIGAGTKRIQTDPNPNLNEHI